MLSEAIGGALLGTVCGYIIAAVLTAGKHADMSTEISWHKGETTRWFRDAQELGKRAEVAERRVVDLEQGRDAWRRMAKGLEQEVDELQSELAKLRGEQRQAGAPDEVAAIADDVAQTMPGMAAVGQVDPDEWRDRSGDVEGRGPGQQGVAGGAVATPGARGVG